MRRVILRSLGAFVGLKTRHRGFASPWAAPAALKRSLLSAGAAGFRRKQLYPCTRTFNEGPVKRAWHDPLKRCESIVELQRSIDEALFSREPVVIVDTAAVFFYPEINLRMPGARYLFVRRQMPDVMNSLARAKQPNEMIREANKHYNAVRGLVNADKHMSMHVQYEDLSNVRVLYNMWRFFGFLDQPPEGHFERMIGDNIQIPFEEQAKRTDRDKVARLFANRRSWV